ncbi:uncharacterized protein LOC118203245 [Stegodyphus dumicola]|uniref:uncharacterized protein LOC118203245 n=1 Tax=Stegodyphus dumicola TaxID=202533 RepID=UPI0015B2686F|nr:uncharacterized protein LOC118203245 [Stegodyphus dumicola]
MLEFLKRIMALYLNIWNMVQAFSVASSISFKALILGILDATSFVISFCTVIALLYSELIKDLLKTMLYAAITISNRITWTLNILRISCKQEEEFVQVEPVSCETFKHLYESNCSASNLHEDCETPQSPPAVIKTASTLNISQEICKQEKKFVQLKPASYKTFNDGLYESNCSATSLHENCKIPQSSPAVMKMISTEINNRICPSFSETPPSPSCVVDIRRNEVYFSTSGSNLYSSDENLLCEEKSSFDKKLYSLRRAGSSKIKKSVKRLKEINSRLEKVEQERKQIFSENLDYFKIFTPKNSSSPEEKSCCFGFLSKLRIKQRNHTLSSDLYKTF